MSRRAWAAIIVLVLLLLVGSISFLQTRGSPPPTRYDDIGTELGSGRIERADDGFAVTTPPEWRAWDPSPGFQRWWDADHPVDLWLEPVGDSETWWMGTCGIGQQCTRERMVEAGGEAYCWIVDDTELATENGWSDPAVPAARTASGLASLDGWSSIGTDIQQLPSGEASRIHAVDPNGWPHEMYHLTDGARWFRLICAVLDGDMDPGAMARTFEFLPAG